MFGNFVAGSRVVVVLLAFTGTTLVVACGDESAEEALAEDDPYPIDLGGTGGGEEPWPADGTDGGPWGDSGGNSQEPDPVCDRPVGEGACTDITLCEAFGCGGKAQSLNHYGCERVQCTAHADCRSDERCYAVALDEVCMPSEQTCSEADGVCECRVTNDCNGTQTSHCLPISFYPIEEDCDVSQWQCGELAERQRSVVSSLAYHAVGENADLVADLGACSARVALARTLEPCTETACQVICEVGSCGHYDDVEACVAACEPLAAEQSEAMDTLLQNLAVAPPLDGECSCDACPPDSELCVGLWGC